MNELTLEQLKAIGSRFPDDILDVFRYKTTIEAKSANCGTSPQADRGPQGYVSSEPA